MNAPPRLVLIVACVFIACSSPNQPTTRTGGDVDNATESMTFDLRDACRLGEISVKFFDPANGLVWPSANQHWVLNGGQQSFKLACRKNSSVCFGASLTADPNRVWGAALSGTRPCNDCCHRCGSSPTPIDLICPSSR